MEVIIFIVFVVCAFIGMGMADSRGRNKVAGFFAGLILGILGLVIIALIGEQK